MIPEEFYNGDSTIDTLIANGTLTPQVEKLKNEYPVLFRDAIDRPPYIPNIIIHFLDLKNKLELIRREKIDI